MKKRLIDSWKTFERIVDSKRVCEQCENYQADSFEFCGPNTCPLWASLDVPCEETCVGYESKNTDWEKCQNCGRRYSTVWNCNLDVIWEQIIGKEYAGLYCPMCFDQMAQAKGIRLYWSCATCEETPPPTDSSEEDAGDNINNAQKVLLQMALDKMDIKIAAWEADEDIMTFNGRPIGGTLSRRGGLQIDRWWLSLKIEIIALVVDVLSNTPPPIPISSSEEPDTIPDDWMSEEVGMNPVEYIDSELEHHKTQTPDEPEEEPTNDD
jgi:hypothetical protein